MKPYWSDDQITLHLGDCLDVLAGMEDASVDAVVTDPPAGIGFMNREWDDFRRARGPEYGRGERDLFVAWLSERMAAAMRVLKPGGYALVWSIPRTAHWTAWALEDAGLEIRDCIPHLFGSGFPKSLDVAKAIDRAGGSSPEVQAATLRAARERAGLSREEAAAAIGCTVSSIRDWEEGRRRAVGAAIEFLVPSPDYRDKLADLLGYSADERVIVGAGGGRRSLYETGHRGIAYGAPSTEDAARWEGWGTALKPGQEMWWLARKPIRGTVASNVLEYGTGALNIAGCKVGTEARVNNAGGSSSLQRVSRVEHGYRQNVTAPAGEASEVAGRWPPNLVLTHSASCELVGTRQVRGDSRSGQEPGERQGGFADVGADRGSKRPNGALHGDQSVEVFDCAPDCPVAELDRQSGVLTSGANPTRRGSDVFSRDTYGDFVGQRECTPHRGADSGGASRFYPVFRYQAKAPSSERPRSEDGTAHPCVKSLGLMSWLARLITPPGGTVLDLFAGSGPTAEACIIEGFKCVLIEKELKSAELIRSRLRKDIQPAMFGEAL